jgi:hypothetical protein
VSSKYGKSCSRAQSRTSFSLRPWSAIAVGAIAVWLLQELLVLAAQVLFKDDASDLKVRVLVSKTGLFLSKRLVEI